LENIVNIDGPFGYGHIEKEDTYMFKDLPPIYRNKETLKDNIRHLVG
jgi:hypothetical protein